MLIGIANDNLWRRFCKAVGRHELAEDPRFRTSPDRVKNRAETVALVQDIVRTRTRDEWVALLLDLGVPCAPINTLKEALDHPQTAARGLVLEYPHEVLGPIKTIALPILFDGAPRDAGTPPPMLGEHSRAVLQEIGYEDAEIARLAGSGIIVDGAA